MLLLPTLALCLVASLPAAEEGPLDNDAFQPTDLAGEEALETWRAELEVGRDEAAFEALRRVLTGGAVGAGLRPDPTDNEGRLVLGLEEAVRLELEALEPARLGAWLARFEDLAAASRELTSDAHVERAFPGTAVALGAALRLADGALEAGRSSAARTWCERAADHLELRVRAGLGATPAGAAAAIDLRLELVRSWSTTGPLPLATSVLPPAWEAASDLGRPAALAFEFEGNIEGEEPFLGALYDRPTRVDPERGPGRGVRPGLVALGEDRVAIQTAAGVHLVNLAEGPRRELVFDPSRLVEEVLGRVGRSQSARRGGAPGWGHLPRATEDALVLVVGRAHTHRGPNALMRVDLADVAAREVDPLVPGSLDTGAPFDQAAPRWILSGARWWSEGSHRDDPLLDELAEAELQPGPVIVDDRVIVSLRTLDGELKHHLVALDLATGEPLWSRLIAKGSVVEENGDGRFGTGTFPRGGAPPLVEVDGRIFVGTHLGVGAMVDAADGRLLWSFKNRRRPPTEPGWSGLEPLTTPAGIAWAPADSDHLYLLPDGPVEAPLDSAGGAASVSLPLAPPMPLGEATDLVASDGARHLCLARAGAEPCLSSIDPREGTRIDSVYLRRGELFAGRPAHGEERVLVASNRGLFLFDRADELRLVDHRPLPFGRGPRAAGGDALALGDRVLVLGPGTLWVLERD